MAIVAGVSLPATPFKGHRGDTSVILFIISFRAWQRYELRIFLADSSLTSET